MAVASVNLLSKGRATLTRDGVRYRDTWQVRTDTATDDADTVLLAVGLPQLGDLRTGSSSFVTDIEPSQDDEDRLNWIVTVTYEPPDNDLSGGNPGTPPTSRPTVRRWQSVAVEKPLIKDRDGEPVLNTAGIAPDPPPTYRAFHSMATFRRYETSFSDATANTYIGAINSTTWGTKPAGTVMCVDLSAEESYEDSVQYWIVTYVFEYNPDGWQPELLSNGYLQKTAAGTGHEDCLDADGEPVREPVPLDENGRQIDADTLPGAAYYITIDRYEEVDFNDLNLDLGS